MTDSTYLVLILYVPFVFANQCFNYEKSNADLYQHTDWLLANPCYYLCDQ